MKLIILIISFSTLIVVQNSNNEEDRVFWNATQKLTWEDFKGAPNYKEIYSARTFCVISSKMSRKNDSVVFTIKAAIQKNKSWVKLDQKTISCLEHEQLHFDITELSVRLFRKKLLEYVFNRRTIRTEFGKLVNEFDLYHLKLQDQYDNETNHRLNIAKQNDWNKKISSELCKAEKYDNPIITIILNE